MRRRRGRRRRKEEDGGEARGGGGGRGEGGGGGGGRGGGGGEGGGGRRSKRRRKRRRRRREEEEEEAAAAAAAAPAASAAAAASAAVAQLLVRHYVRFQTFLLTLKKTVLEEKLETIFCHVQLRNQYAPSTPARNDATQHIRTPHKRPGTDATATYFEHALHARVPRCVRIGNCTCAASKQAAVATGARPSCVSCAAGFAWLALAPWTWPRPAPLLSHPALLAGGP